jgi:hypothetical protein
VAPASVHWEVGNALSALLKRRLASRQDVLDAAAAYEEIPLRFVDVDLGDALELSADLGLYAYDAYLREGSVRIRRKDGTVFVLRPERTTASPLDVPSVPLRLTRAQVLAAVQDGRRPA